MSESKFASGDADFFDTVSKEPSHSLSTNRFVISYTLQGKEYVECLDAYLDVRGDAVLRMGRDEIEKLHVDLGYYRVTFIFALKEMSQTLYLLEVGRDRWLSKVRLTVLESLRTRRAQSKKDGITISEATQREIDDNIIANYADEYFDWDSKIHDAQSDVDRIKELIKEIDSRRIQFQGLVKYRYSP